MAIESIYWKEELARLTENIRPVSKPKRWSERLVCTVERDIMIGCFIVRRMIELQKVSSRVTGLHLDVFSVPVVKSVTKLSRFQIDENYDWSAEKPERKSAIYICNQCIHAYVSFMDRTSDRNCSHMLVVSDYDRKSVIWRIPISSFLQLFDTASKDWASWQSMVYDPKLGDYRITTD